MTARKAFTYSAIALFIGGAIHIIGYFLGPETIEFLGAPAGTVQSMRDGTSPALIACFAIAALLFGLSYLSYRASKERDFGKIPRLILILFAAIFTVRGVLVVIFIPGIVKWSFGPDPAKFWFHVFASLFVLSIGLALTKGLVKTAGSKV